MTRPTAPHSTRILLRKSFPVILASLGALGAWAACSRFPDPTEHLSGGGPGTGGATSSLGGATWASGASTAFGGGGGEGPVLVECGEPPIVGGAFSKTALLEASARCAEWHYCGFEDAAAKLHERVMSWAEDPSDASRAQAQQAFRNAFASWSKAELFQYGPAGNATSDPYHGAGYRERIYNWPEVARCRVEDQIASQRYLSTGMGEIMPSARGLYAVEYVLFYPGSDHACLSTSSAAKTWATLSQAELDARKQRYGAAVAEDVLGLTRELRASWAPEGGNFQKTLIEAAGYDKPAIDKQQEALNIVAWSFVYIELQLKDWKVGYPAGLSPDSVSGFEAPHAGQAVQAVRANLRAFRSLFEGCGNGGAGLGFDDWLRAAGHGDLADDMIAAWQHAQGAADAFPAFEQAAQPDDFLALHAAVKQLTDLIKNDFLAGAGSPLNLSMSAGVEGDND